MGIMGRNANVHSETKPQTGTNAAARPLAELLACSMEASALLNGSSACISFDAGETIFRQGDRSRGLYLVVSGDLMRKAERKHSRVTLGSVRAGDLLELAAALGDGVHTYTVTAQTPGILMLLPISALHQAFAAYPPLQMHLLQELAREVSRSYANCIAIHNAARRGAPKRELYAGNSGQLSNGSHT
jgi:CRP-like cAMP-binding protein